MAGVTGDRAGAVVVRVDGPLVEIDGAAGVGMLDVVALGPRRIRAETVAISGDHAVLQAYEYTGGLRVGDPAEPSGQALSGLLGPGLLGSVFDGLLRPLSSAPLWLSADRAPATEDPQLLGQEWTFVPAAREGCTLSAGELLGTVPLGGPVEYRVMVPPGVGGVLTSLAPSGAYRPLDTVATVGGVGVTLAEQWPIRRARPFRDRLTDAVPLHTGQRVLDLLYPVVKGSAAAVPGGFGTGKTLLLQQIAKWSDADVIVYVGCGERGNEMADVLGELSELRDDRTGGRLLDRTVIVANTSNMPMMAREASIYTGATVAEFFRDMGYDVVVIADSTSRWAEAMREFANRNGELPAEESYPATLASRLAAFYERAGRVTTGGGRTGSVTIIGAVSPPGGDLTEPVTVDTERFVRALWLLDRDLAYARHYPAVSWDGSFANDADAVARWAEENGNSGWAERRARAIALLTEADRLRSLAEVIGVSSLQARDRMLLLGGRLLRDGVLFQSALSRNDTSCSAAKGAALLDLVLGVVDTCCGLVEDGVPATMVEEIDFGPVIRAREETGPADDQSVRERLGEMTRLLGCPRGDDVTGGAGDPGDRRLLSFGDIRSVRGPLLTAAGVNGVGWDEAATIDTGNGPERHGLVLEVDRDRVTVQVLEGTDGLRPDAVRVRFAGEPFAVPVGEGWLGRVCNGRGEPLDGGPPIAGDKRMPVGGLPLNPVLRQAPEDPILTGISVIDGLATLVRGQKLPIFSIPGLPHLTLATQIAAHASSLGATFRVIFAGMGLTHADIAYVRDRLEERSAAGELVLLLNAADDPVVERILTPRIALTIAESLAFDDGSDVLVVMSDMTSYAEAVREVSAARREVPARRGYPGYLYSDLASLYERCGLVRGQAGSVTIIPVLTMPAGDITHPVADLTGYITEGQIVLDPGVHARGVYPPVDVLSSLSRLMRHGAGPGRTREDHLDVAAQVMAALATARQASELAELIGAASLSETDQRYLTYRDAVERRLFDQGVDEERTFAQTLDRAWSALAELPKRELTMLPADLIAQRLPDRQEEP